MRCRGGSWGRGLKEEQADEESLAAFPVPSLLNADRTAGGAQQPIWVDRTAGSPAANLGHEATLGMEGPHRMELMVGGPWTPDKTC